MCKLPKKYFVVYVVYVTFLLLPFFRTFAQFEIKTDSDRTTVNATVPIDADWDGIPNWWEDKYGLDKENAADANADPDGDGLTNLQEYLHNTDPNNPDTDGDGLNDYEEIYLYLTNPNKVDSDEDGLTDYEEVKKYGTNPNRIDTDYDGLTDYEELFIYKTNPLDWDTDDGGMSDGDEINNGSNPNYKDDDFIFVWSVYYGDQANDLFKSLEDYKITVFESMNLTLEAIRPKDVSKISIIFNNKTLETEKDFIKLKIISPKEPGIYTLKLILDLKTGKTVELLRFVEIKPRGKIISKIQGKFNKLYAEFDYFKDKYVDNAKIEIIKLNEITKENELYKPRYFHMTNPQYSSAEGKYLALLEPGTYIIKITKPELGTKQILFNTDKPYIYSQDMYIIYNYDLLVWITIFTAIFLTVWILLEIMQFLTELFRKHIENKAMKKYIYRNG